VSGSNALEITDSIFDACSSPVLGADGQRRSRSPQHTAAQYPDPVNQEPDYTESHPSLVFVGSSKAAKTFQATTSACRSCGSITRATGRSAAIATPTATS